MPRAYIGTSGWNYPAWRDGFYGQVPARDWLRFCGERFTGIEINATFYRLQESHTFRHWREQTPPGFRFALKANRYLTHTRRLKEPAAPVATERKHARALGDQLAVVLWQLPGNFKRNDERLDTFLAALSKWRRTRHTIEFRHRSWFDDAVAERLGAHGVAACISDAADWPRWDVVTTDLVYVRLHGHTRTYASAYSRRSLLNWAARTNEWLHSGCDVHVYFDNDAEGAAPRNALQLLEKVAQGG